MTWRDEILPPTADVVVTALTNARLLVEDGHCKGQAHAVISEQDCWCAMGALAKVCSTVVVGSWADYDRRGEVVIVRQIVPGRSIFEAAVEALRIAMSPRWAGTLAEFNDASSQDAVVNLFHRAAAMVMKAVA